MQRITEYLDSIGPIGSIERLKAISNMDLGERSEAANRVIHKRCRRKELIESGFNFETACLIVNHEEQN